MIGTLAAGLAQGPQRAQQERLGPILVYRKGKAHPFSLQNIRMGRPSDICGGYFVKFDTATAVVLLLGFGRVLGLQLGDSLVQLLLVLHVFPTDGLNALEC